LFIDIASDRNVIQKDAENKLEITSEAFRLMWNKKCVVIRVVIGARGTVTKELKMFVVAMQRNQSLDSLYIKKAALGR
jgi:hypothetical protein